jgi:hypothetical protein
MEAVVLAAHRGGMSILDMSRALGVSKSPLQRILIEAGVERRMGRPTLLTERTLPVAIHLYRQCRSLSEVARVFDTTTTRVRRAFIAAGEPLDTRMGRRPKEPAA